MTRMSDERLAELSKALPGAKRYSGYFNELLAALKAERQENETLRQRVVELGLDLAANKMLLSRACEYWHRDTERAEAAEAKLDAVRGLVEKWMGTWAETCADELMEVLGD